VLEAEAFARLRFGQRALLGLLAELYPAWNDLRASETKASLPKDQASLDELKKLGAEVRLAAEADAALAATELSPKLRASLARKREVQRFLEHCGVRTKRTKKTLTGKQLAALRRRRTILANLEKNRPITKGLREGSPAAKRMLKEWDTVLGELEKLEVVEVEVEAKVKATAPSGPEVRLAKGKETLAELDRARKAYAPFEAFAQKLTLTAGTAVEIINVANAMRDLAEAMETGAPTGKKSLSVLGALADLVEHGAGMTESFFGSGMSEAAKGWVKKVGGVAGVVGGVIDMLDYEEQARDAYAEYDYGKAVGRSLQTAGAAASAAGSAMVLVAAIGEATELGTSLGIVGVIIALAGSVLVVTGHFVAKWLELNANQKFAIRSFLGWHRQGAGAKLSWSEVALPTKDPREEALALSDLLAQFQVSRGGYSDDESRDWEVELIPGFYEEGSRFEVDIETSWDNKAPQALLGAARTAGEPGCGDVARLPEPVRFRLLVDLGACEVRQLEGPALKPGEVRRDAEGEVESVYLNLEEEVEPEKLALEEGPLKVDEVAGLLAGPPSSSFLRTHAYRVTRLKVRLVRPVKGDEPTRYVPREEGRAIEVILPSMAVVTSLDAPVGVPMEVWAPPPPEPRSPEEDN
jgi:hypothetical protein